MLDSSRVISGSYGECVHEGKWLTNIYKMSADVDIDKADVKRAGSLWTGKKVMGLSGTGSITGYKVTSELLQKISSVCSGKGEFRTELISVLDDPEAFGHERIRLKNVTFDKITLVGWEVGSLCEEEWTFTFEGYELLDPIVA